MDAIIKEKYETFKDMERDIFSLVCRIGVELTRMLLEKRDLELMEGRDRKKYRNVGLRGTTVKTVYGDVGYRRREYRTETGDGKAAYVFLLDEEVGMQKIGLVSENLAGIIADAATGQPYRKAAGAVGASTGGNMSAGGVWNLLQAIGEKIGEEEELDVARMEAGEPTGEKVLPLLFEEMDGVWVGRQGPGHGKMPMQEVKVSTTYEGWDAGKEAEGRSTLVGKRAFAGVMKAGEFHKRHEAEIERIYDPDEIGQRVLNGDGGAWIGDPYDPDTVTQLDRFHIQQEILRDIPDKDAQEGVRERLCRKDVDGALEYILAYSNSVESGDPRDQRAAKARKLHTYLLNNRESLLPWQDRVGKIPDPPDGILYKGMGVQENQNCTLVTLRMKHRRMRWSESGADNMAKALYRKENGELRGTVGRYSGHPAFPFGAGDVCGILSAAKAPVKDGKGDAWPDLFGGHAMLIDAAQTAARKVFRQVFVDGLQDI